jgi:hypothetical protein
VPFLPSRVKYPCGFGTMRSASGVVVSENEKRKNKIKKKEK